MLRLSNLCPSQESDRLTQSAQPSSCIVCKVQLTIPKLTAHLLAQHGPTELAKAADKEHLSCPFPQCTDRLHKYTRRIKLLDHINNKHHKRTPHACGHVDAAANVCPLAFNQESKHPPQPSQFRSALSNCCGLTLPAAYGQPHACGNCCGAWH